MSALGADTAVSRGKSFKHVGQLIGKEQPQAQRRVALAEIAEQGQEQVTPEVRRHGPLYPNRAICVSSVGNPS